MWGDFEVHVKFRILKCGKYTNFIRTMNVFLLAPILGCMFEIVYGEMSEAGWESENCQVVWSLVLLAGQVKTIVSYQKCRIYIDIHVTWPSPNTRFIFCVGQNQNERMYLNTTAHDYSVQSGSWNYSIYFCT